MHAEVESPPVHAQATSPSPIIITARIPNPPLQRIIETSHRSRRRTQPVVSAIERKSKSPQCCETVVIDAASGGVMFV
jgi:hypothetical protein